MADAARVLRLMNTGLEERKQFVSKPYRDRAALVEVLKQKFPLIPVELFSTTDDRWKEKAGMQLEFRRRMQNGENPVMLSKVLVIKGIPGHISRASPVVDCRASPAVDCRASPVVDYHASLSDL
jgi:hypothetical protein